jgi:hypothetical protein
MPKPERPYMSIGVQVAKHALRARRDFSSYDVRVRARKDIPPRIVRVWVKEFLKSFAEPGRGMDVEQRAIMDSCPVLGAKTRMLWKGY